MSNEHGSNKNHFSRRGFLQGMLAGTAVEGVVPLVGRAEAAADGYYPATPEVQKVFDFTQSSAALAPDAS